MDPVAFSIFGIDVAWYGILISLGVLLGTLLGLREAKRVGIEEDDLLDFLIITIPLAIVGARLYYVIFSWDLYKGDLLKIIDIRSGGLAIHGGIIMAIISGLVFTKRRGIDFFKLADVSAPSLALGQAIGRWGNYINQEAYGGPTNLPWGIMVQGVKVHPTFFYESLGNMVLVLFLIWYRKNKQKNTGEIFSIYLFAYSGLRFLVEGLRTDSLMLGNFRVAQIVSFIGIVAGVIMFRHRRNEK